MSVNRWTLQPLISTNPMRIVCHDGMPMFAIVDPHITWREVTAREYDALDVPISPALDITAEQIVNALNMIAEIAVNAERKS